MEALIRRPGFFDQRERGHIGQHGQGLIIAVMFFGEISLGAYRTKPTGPVPWPGVFACPNGYKRSETSDRFISSILILARIRLVFL